MRKWIYRWGPYLPLAVALVVPALALARVGGGESYSSGRSSGGGDDGAGDVFAILIWLAFEHPVIGVPLLIIFTIGYLVMKRNTSSAKTQRAFQQAEAEVRTQVTAQDVVGFVNALKLKDPSFDLLQLLEKVKQLFVASQAAWMKRDMAPVRPFLSDASYQRFVVQLKLLATQGVRDAIADVVVQDLQLIGLDQSEWFDTVHVRVKASMRDTDVPASTPDAQAVAAAMKAAPETFTEVWSFVRKPGAKTKIGEDLYQGKCPNCGAPFQGGAANKCEFCNAVVNSGNFDWTLSGITQGVEHIRHYAMVDGLMAARAKDPALNLEMLEDRATLIFWKWVDAQSAGDAKRLSKLSTGASLTTIDAELSALKAQRRRKVFLECAIGAATTRVLEQSDGYDTAHIEVRWSARMGIGPADQAPPALPTVPQRWMFSLVRKAGATTNVSNGMSTHRCPQCGGPLTESISSTCDYCGAELAGGDRDWVLASAASYEAWNATENQRFRARQAAGSTAAAPAGPAVITDKQERERLLYMMAAMAAADGVVDAAEMKLLKMCSQRWSVAWANVELALKAGPALFDRLVQKGSPEAEVFLKALVDMALIDGKIDRAERKMLNQACEHLGIAPPRLAEMLGGK
jgi:tellurite resistance protein